MENNFLSLIADVLSSDVGFVLRFFWVVISFYGVLAEFVGNRANRTAQSVCNIPERIPLCEQDRYFISFVFGKVLEFLSFFSSCNFLKILTFLSY